MSNFLGFIFGGFNDTDKQKTIMQYELYRDCVAADKRATEKKLGRQVDYEPLDKKAWEQLGKKRYGKQSYIGQGQVMPVDGQLRHEAGLSDSSWGGHSWFPGL